MSLLFTLAAFAVTLGVLIVVHEYGHYLVARLCGVKVLRFSVGFGNPIYSKRFKPDGTEWAVAAFPLGGYVKMLDEREAPVEADDLPYAFNRKPVWQRMLIVAAGPVANFLLAMVIYWGLYVHGMPGLRPVLEAPPASSAAHQAGLNRGDTILRIAGEAVNGWEQVALSLLPYAVDGGRVEILVQDEQGRGHVLSLNVPKVEEGRLKNDFLADIGLSPAKFAQPRVGEVLPNSPAAKAGLKTGDWIRSVNGVEVADWKSLVQEIRRQPGKALKLEIIREGRQMQASVTAEQVMERGETFGRIGAGAYAVNNIQYGVGPALVAGFEKTWQVSKLSLEMLWKVVKGDLSWRNLGGPVSIADYAGQSAQLGWIPFLTFLAWISTSLFVMNLLPVPVLDGGHLMYYTAEAITRRPVSERVLLLGQKIGMALLFSLLLFALYNDINRLLGP